MHTGLLAPGHVESSWARNRTHVPCSGRRILNHWTAREVRALVLTLSEMRSLWKGLRKRWTYSELQFPQDFSGCPVEQGVCASLCHSLYHSLLHPPATPGPHTPSLALWSFLDLALNCFGTRHQRPANKSSGFPRGSDSKESACNAGDLGLCLDGRAKER